MISLTGLVAHHCAEKNVLPAKFNDLKLGPKTFPHKLYDENDNEYELDANFNLKRESAYEDYSYKRDLYFFSNANQINLITSSWCLEATVDLTGTYGYVTVINFFSSNLGFNGPDGTRGCPYYNRVSLQSYQNYRLKYTFWSNANEDISNYRCENLTTGESFEKLDCYYDVAYRPSTITGQGLGLNLSDYYSDWKLMNMQMLAKDIKLTVDDKIVFAY